MAKEMHWEKVLMLSELGIRSKFKVWIGKKNRYARDKLSSRSTLNYLPLPEDLERIRRGIEQFDILWLKRNKILYHFQMVEGGRLSPTLRN